jgi:hypothetical protein
MSTMEQLMMTGLDVEFEAHFADFFLADDEAKKQQLRDLVDANGLKDPTVMKAIGQLQRDKVLKPGIYKEFVGLQQKLEAAAGNGQSAAAPTTPATTPPAQTETPATTPATTPPDEGLTPEQIASHQFTDEQEDAIKKKLAAEEEKMRQRLLARESKIREQMITGKVQRATRLGLKAEDAAKIDAAREQVKKNNDQIKALREDNKAQKAIIEEIRPKRNVKQASHAQKQLRVAKRKLTMATKTGDAAAIAEAKKNLATWEATVAAETPAAA